MFSNDNAVGPRGTISTQVEVLRRITAQSFEQPEGEVIDNVSRGDAIKLSERQLKSLSRTCSLLRRSIEEGKRKHEHTNTDIRKNRLAFAA
jgi:hypothetical protein